MLNKQTRMSHTAKFTKNKFIAVCILWFLNTTAQTITLPTDPVENYNKKKSIKKKRDQSKAIWLIWLKQMHGADESMENAHAEKTDLVFYVRHPCGQSVPCGEVLLRLQREIF